MVEVLAILLFLILLTLSTLAARRSMMSRSTNVVLYAGFAVISALSAVLLMYGVLQGFADIGQALMAVGTLQVAWLFMRGLSRAQHAARRGDVDSYRARREHDAMQIKDMVPFKSVRT